MRLFVDSFPPPMEENFLSRAICNVDSNVYWIARNPEKLLPKVYAKTADLFVSARRSFPFSRSIVT